MFKKLLFAGLLLGAGSFIWFKTLVGTHVQVALEDVGKYLDSQVPIEQKIKVVKKLIADLEGKIKKADRECAREEAAMLKATSTLTTKENELALLRDDIVRLRNDVQTQATNNNVGAKTRNTVLLARKFNSFEALQTTTEIERKTIETRRQRWEAADTKAKGLASARKELTQQVETLDSQRRLQEARNIATKVESADGELNKIKTLIEKIKTDLAEEVIFQERQEQAANANPTSDVNDPETLLDRIDRAMGLNNGAKAADGKAKGTAL